MTSVTSLWTSVNSLITDAGQQVMIRHFSISGGSATYDDNVVLSRSGNDVWVSGIVQTFDTTKGSKEAVLLQQGKLLSNDIKLFFNGSVDLTGVLKLGMNGSPPTDNYSIVEGGVNTEVFNGSPVYQKAYIRRISTGSLYGE